MHNPLHIIIDSREQTPWAFPPELATVTVAKLDAGDYALAGDTEFAVERKSLDDFAGTISSGWERFEREIARMSSFATKVMIVEGRLLGCCFHEQGTELVGPQHRHCMITPQFVMKRVAELTMHYDMHVLFADNADIAAGLAYAVLLARAKEREEV